MNTMPALPSKSIEIEYQEFKATAERTNLTVQQALDRVFQLFMVTAENFKAMALGLRYVEEKGGDLSGPRGYLNGLFDVLRLIAYGKLLPECLVALGGKTKLAELVGKLEAHDQHRVMYEGVPLLVYSPDGTLGDVVQAKLSDMTPDQVRQVIGNGCIRTEAQQNLLIRDWRKKKAPLEAAVEIYDAVIDPDAQTVRTSKPVAWTGEQVEKIYQILRKGKRKRRGTA